MSNKQSWPHHQSCQNFHQSAIFCLFASSMIRRTLSLWVCRLWGTLLCAWYFLWLCMFASNLLLHAQKKPEPGVQFVLLVDREESKDLGRAISNTSKVGRLASGKQKKYAFGHCCQCKIREKHCCTATALDSSTFQPRGNLHCQHKSNCSSHWNGHYLRWQQSPSSHQRFADFWTI